MSVVQTYDEKVENLLADVDANGRQRAFIDAYKSELETAGMWRSLHAMLDARPASTTQMWSVFIATATFIFVTAPGLPAISYVVMMAVACGVTGHYSAKVLKADVEGLTIVDAETRSLTAIRMAAGGATAQDVLLMAQGNKKREEIFHRKAKANNKNVDITRLVSIALPIGAIVVLALHHFMP